MAEPTGKELYEQRKREREGERKTVPGPKRSYSSYLWIVITILILGALGWWFYRLVQKQLPQGEDLSQVYEIVSRTHIDEGSPRPTYNTNPPTSGDHYATPARVGYYDYSFPDERLVHNLEHGDIWISYKPSVSMEVKQALRDFASDVKVIITSREANDADVALAAWGRLDTFNLSGATLSESEVQRIQDFIARYKNKGPEKVIDSGAHLPDE